MTRPFRTTSLAEIDESFGVGGAKVVAFFAITLDDFADVLGGIPEFDRDDLDSFAALGYQTDLGPVLLIQRDNSPVVGTEIIAKREADPAVIATALANAAALDASHCTWLSADDE